MEGSLWGDSTGELPLQSVSNAESVSMSWRHHAIRSVRTYRAVQTQCHQHDEEDDGPSHRAWQGGYSFRVDHED